jgi:hypothetical protein
MSGLNFGSHDRRPRPFATLHDDRKHVAEFSADRKHVAEFSNRKHVAEVSNRKHVEDLSNLFDGIFRSADDDETEVLASLNSLAITEEAPSPLPPPPPPLGLEKLHVKMSP